MAHLGTCSICGGGTLDAHICRTCEQVVARRAIAGLPFDKEAVLKDIEKIKDAERALEIREMLKRSQICPRCGK